MAEGMVQEKLNVYYLLDTSGSMSGPKIQQLNECMTNLKPELEKSGIDNNVGIVVRAIEFGNNETATWHTGSAANGQQIESFVWTNLHADGSCTPTSQALEEVAKALTPEYLGARTLRPIIILVSDGACTDGAKVYENACNTLAKKIDGKAIRIAIGVDGANTAELEQYASRDGESGKPFVYQVNNAEDMVKIIRWASVVSIKQSVKIPIGGGNDNGGVSLPDPGGDIWI